MVLMWTSASQAETSVEARTSAFIEPSPTSPMTVLIPSLDLRAVIAESLELKGGYEVDIVSGASERLKAGPIQNIDVVSGATRFEDQRHVLSAGLGIERGLTRLSAGYAYGFENDYRSHAINVTAVADLLKRNTQLELGYGHGFDSVCTAAYEPSLHPSRRPALDDSSDCFGGSQNRQSQDVSSDSFQLAWTQSWTPVFVTQWAITGALLRGFLANPYREVALSSNDQALEHHPEHRARAAASLRGKYFFRTWKSALSLRLGVYRDTWAVTSQTVELEAERNMTRWMRLLVRARAYHQSGALFWSDDYTGGEPEMGPRGQYWTGDRELSPFFSYLVGTRLQLHEEGSSREPAWGPFEELALSLSANLLKTELMSFTWGGVEPDDTMALIFSLGLSGKL